MSDTFLGGPAWANQGIRYCYRCEPRPHEVVMNFGQYKNIWHAHFLAADCATPISRYYHLADVEAVRGMMNRTFPPAEVVAEFENCIRAWGRAPQAD